MPCCGWGWLLVDILNPEMNLCCVAAPATTVSCGMSTVPILTSWYFSVVWNPVWSRISANLAPPLIDHNLDKLVIAIAIPSALLFDATQRGNQSFGKQSHSSVSCITMRLLADGSTLAAWGSGGWWCYLSFLAELIQRTRSTSHHTTVHQPMIWDKQIGVPATIQPNNRSSENIWLTPPVTGIHALQAGCAVYNADTGFSNDCCSSMPGCLALSFVIDNIMAGCWGCLLVCDTLGCSQRLIGPWNGTRSGVVAAAIALSIRMEFDGAGSSPAPPQPWLQLLMALESVPSKVLVCGTRVRSCFLLGVEAESPAITPLLRRSWFRQVFCCNNKRGWCAFSSSSMLHANFFMNSCPNHISRIIVAHYYEHNQRWLLRVVLIKMWSSSY